MTRLIKTAIPTDLTAINYLESLPDGSIIPIEPLTAKTMFPNYITDKKNFVCPTSNCKAPITCRSIAETSRNRPTFVNGSRTDNKHRDGCIYHPDTLVEGSSINVTKESALVHINSGKTISVLSKNKGFSGEKGTKNGVSQNENGTEPSQPGSTRTSTTTSPKPIKITNQHLRTLQDHVELFTFNPDYKISTQNSKFPIPIKYLFKKIKGNVSFPNLHTMKYSSIFWGAAYLSWTKKPSVIRINFGDKLPFNGTDISPSFIVSKEHIETEYPDIYDEFSNGDRSRFDVFTVLPFYQNDPFINSSSLKKNESVDPFSEELFNNFYIR